MEYTCSSRSLPPGGPRPVPLAGPTCWGDGRGSFRESCTPSNGGSSRWLGATCGVSCTDQDQPLPTGVLLRELGASGGGGWSWYLAFSRILSMTREVTVLITWAFGAGLVVAHLVS